ncbi:HAD-IIB family hydrolase [Catalinimonas sp. 4WD22]|uniref:HAD-IIB family hydrolase n=1 Tax=Catalinimonas locisalis TaxID=3133978 RepID=UPI003100AB82
MKWIVYTDLDGTLLDFRNYSYKTTQNSVELLLKKEIPVIFCSSKTRVEQEVYRKALQLDFPFIVENGSAIIIPKYFFDFELDNQDFLKPYKISQLGGYTTIVLGESFEKIRSIIAFSRAETEAQVCGYQDLSIQEIMDLTGLDEAFAKRAASRDFSETLLKGVNGSSSCIAFLQKLEDHNLQCVSGGKFHTVMGKGSDKGLAVNILNKLLELKYGKITTVGLGDSANDLPLLKAVDHPFLVQKPSGKWQEIADLYVQKVNAIGPEGWNLAIQSIFA